MSYIDHKKSAFLFFIDLSISEKNICLVLVYQMIYVYPFMYHYYAFPFFKCITTSRLSLNGQVLEYQSQTHIHSFVIVGEEETNLFLILHPKTILF